MHYQQYTSIRASIPEYGRTINRAKQFWSLLLNAHLEATRMALSRAYDQLRKPASLRTWLESIRDNPDILETDELTIREAFRSEPLPTSEITDDLALVGKRDDLVKRLIVQRGNFFAHSSAADNTETILAQYLLTFSDYDELIERGKRILNRYSVLHDGRLHGMDTRDFEDWKIVLADCQAGRGGGT